MVFIRPHRIEAHVVRLRRRATPALAANGPTHQRPKIIFAVIVAALLIALLGLPLLSTINGTAAAASITAQVAASADDARSTDLGTYTATEASALVGAGYQRPNVNGYRFAALALPPGAIIDAVAFSLVKQGDQWQQFQVQLAFEASDTAAAFTAAAPRRPPPHRRDRRRERQRQARQRHPLHPGGERRPGRRPAGGRRPPGWRSGNSVAVIAYGAATTGYARLTFATVDAGTARAPRLEVTFHLPAATSPTPTASSVAAATRTATAQATAIATAIATPTATATRTATAITTATPTSTATPTAMAQAPATPTPTASASTNPTPVAEQPCPAWVHDRYVAQGPDGNLYPTWHPTIDPQYGCFFGHEHGDDPTDSASLRGHPVLFGYAAAKEGMTEPHAGFKVYRWDPHTNVSNPTSSTTASVIMVLHQGTAGPARFNNVFHSAEYHYWNPADGREVHIDMLAPFGKFAVGCGANDPGMISVQQANVPGVRQVAGAQCYAAARWPDPTGVLPGTIPYEDWLTALYIGKDPSGNWKAYIDPHFAVFNPNTYCLPNAGLPATSPCTIGYSDVRAGHGIDPASTASEFKGVKREAYLNQVWLANAGGPTIIWTDPYGNLVAAGSANAIPQYISSVNYQKQDGSNAFGQDRDHDPDGTVRAPN